MRDLSKFNGAGYDKGRSWLVQAMWVAVQNLIFLKWWCPGWLRVSLLRAFGAEVGDEVLIRHRVRILWPWKLSIGDNSWIGEGAWLLNLEEISIGSNVCISQEVFLCTGSHSHSAVDFGYRNGSVAIGDGAWVAARATLLRGVTVESQAVVPAGVTVPQDATVCRNG